MSALVVPESVAPPVPPLTLDELGTLTPVGRAGGQGRVYRPQYPLATDPVVVKLYRRAPPASAVEVLSEMIGFADRLPEGQRTRLHGLTAWPVAIVTGPGEAPAGIVMRDLTARFSVPFTMPSGRCTDVLLSLEHLLGDDTYLLARGLDVGLGTALRLRAAERVAGALAFLHELGIVVCDIAPNNLLVTFRRSGPPVSFIDCDSMVFRGRQALAPVQTTDWQLPDDEAPGTRAGDSYKLGLIVLRLLARCHDARSPAAFLRHVPMPLREPLARALGPDPSLRPAPGEWQRALRALGATPGIGRLYPGPPARPLVRPAMPAPSLTPPRRRGPAPAPAPAPARLAPARLAARRRPHPSNPTGFGAVALVGLVIGAILFTLVLARLFAGAIPTESVPQFSGGAKRQVYIAPGGGQDNFGSAAAPSTGRSRGRRAAAGAQTPPARREVCALTAGYRPSAHTPPPERWGVYAHDRLARADGARTRQRRLPGRARRRGHPAGLPTRQSTRIGPTRDAERERLALPTRQPSPNSRRLTRWRHRGRRPRGDDLVATTSRRRLTRSDGPRATPSRLTLPRGLSCGPSCAVTLTMRGVAN